jgi:hypothetical protein
MHGLRDRHLGCAGKTVGRLRRGSVVSRYFQTRKRNFHHHIACIPTSLYADALSLRRVFMLTANQLEVAETVFDRNKRREAEINDAIRQEQARHRAAVKNMLRLRALRLARDTKEESADRKPKVKP